MRRTRTSSPSRVLLAAAEAKDLRRRSLSRRGSEAGLLAPQHGQLRPSTLAVCGHAADGRGQEEKLAGAKHGDDELKVSHPTKG
eukprot:6837032-Prymnesium_polylepis.1